MNFLDEILASKGLAEVEELNEKIQDITKAITQLKEEVTVKMEDNYINFTSPLDETTNLMNKMSSLSVQVNDITERIDIQIKNDVAASKCQLDFLTTALQEVTLSHDLVSRLLNVHQALDAAQSVRKNSKFLETAQQLKKAQEDLQNNPAGLECLQIFEALKAEVVFQQQKHSYNTLKMWSQSIMWSELAIDGSSYKGVTLSLATNIDKEELFKALYYYDLLTSEVREFSEKLLKDVLYSIVSKVTVVNCESSSTITIKIDSDSKKPLCIDVINNLTIVFNFLSLQLNLKAVDDVKFISECKKQISYDFCRHFTKNCLSLTVPKKRDELDAYKELMEEITAFELLLKEIGVKFEGFLDEDDRTIAEYTTNVEELFANKTCEAYLATARKIMKKDLHDIKQTGPVESNAPADLDVTLHLTHLSTYTFQFPSCKISKSTEELLELIHEMLREIPHNTDMCAVKLFYTARNIFTLYCDVVPEFHDRLLDTIPQQSAILHNNAMYLAHQLMFLGPQYKPRMPPVLQDHTTTFVDLVNTLRSLAATVFTKQIQMQKKHIFDILRDSGLVTLSDSPKFPEGIEKAIRQCLRQLALLQTVWQHVLPINIYCKSLGLLCNAFVEEIISKVIAAEDIPADTATQLVVVFTLIQQKAPQVFPDPQEIHRHVKKWAKFGELQLLLGGGLREVDDRWADGKGPLAQEFTAEQVRHLVRALFQISDRRAVLLAKII